MPRTIVTGSAAETFLVAQQLATTLAPGTFVLLSGDLGAGKTVFVKGLASGLGADPDAVTSPTFVLIQHYRGVIPLVHADLYRLDAAAAIEDLGLDELAAGAVVAIEWAERLPEAPPHSVRVTIEDRGGEARTITVE